MYSLSCALEPERLGPCATMYLVQHHEFSQCIHQFLELPNLTWPLPWIIPPIVLHTVSHAISTDAETFCSQNLIMQLQTDINEAKNNLLQAKIFQTHYTNQNRSPEIPFKIGN